MVHLHDLELTWIKTLQEIRSPHIDLFFKGLNFLDTDTFIMLLLAAVWIGSKWKVGLKFYYILSLNALLNVVLKSVFHELRPFFLDPSVAVIHVGGFSFPSGAAQSAVLLPGILLSWKRNVWTWLVAGNFFFWVSLSRVYLGVHFPSDLIAGWLVGGILLSVYLYAFPLAERYLEKKSLGLLLALSVLTPLALSYLFYSSTAIKLAAANIGAGIGVYVSSLKKSGLDSPQSYSEMICRMAWGCATAFAIYYLASQLPLQNKEVMRVVPLFCFGLWLGFGANVLWRRTAGVYSRIVRDEK